MAEYGTDAKGATLSDVTARAEYGVSVYQGIRCGKPRNTAEDRLGQPLPSSSDANLGLIAEDRGASHVVRHIKPGGRNREFRAEETTWP